MINLSRTRAELLAEIDAANLPGDPLSDLTDLRAASVEAHVRVCGRAHDELLPLLKITLSERFAAVPWLQMIRDLLLPLRNNLGNAYKHGTDTISPRLFRSRSCSPPRARSSRSPTRAGASMWRLHFGVSKGRKATSRIMGSDSATCTVRFPWSATKTAATLCCCASGPRSKITTALSTAMLYRRFCVRNGFRSVCQPKCRSSADGAKIESYRVYSARGYAGDDCGNRYVLRLAGRNGRPAETRILTGRLHATEAAAASDFETATKLHEARISTKLHIPRPVALLAGELRLVLYDFDPWMNLCEFFTHHGRIKTLRRIAARVGLGLAKLHCSQVGFRGAEVDFVREELRTMVVRSENYLHTLACGPDLVNRFHVAAQRIESRAAFDRERTLSPIHGALGWDCIHYGVDGRFYLYRFETCRWSDPGLDLGGFAADLLCFTLASYNEEAYRISLDAFLEEYNSEAARPMDKGDLLPYIALALVERLRRAEASAKADAGQLLAALDAVLTVRPSVPERAAPH